MFMYNYDYVGPAHFFKPRGLHAPKAGPGVGSLATFGIYGNQTS